MLLVRLTPTLTWSALSTTSMTGLDRALALSLALTLTLTLTLILTWSALSTT